MIKQKININQAVNSNKLYTLLPAFKITDMIDYTKISDNQHVIQLIKKREELEKQIIKIDKMALVKYELEALNL